MMPAPDLSVYLVLDTGLDPDPVETARAAAEARVGIIQLRAKRASTQERIALAQALRQVIRPFGTCLIVNDDVEAALVAEADGLHIGQSDMAPADARARLGPQRLLGLSVETPAQAALVDPSLVDHAGIGPLRATSTKPDHAAPLGPEGLAACAAVCPVPAVVIGGVTADDAALAVRSGIAGLAVVSAICGQPDPGAAARDLMSAMRRARI